MTETVAAVATPAEAVPAQAGRSIYEFMTELAVRHDAVNLGQGFPDFDGPDVLQEWAREAIRTGCNQYSASAGHADLRAAIGRVLAEGRSLPFDAAEEITVTAGAGEAIAAALLAVVKPGDEVIAFEPFFDYYPTFVGMARARLVPVPLVEAGGRFTFDPDALRRRLTPRTRAVLLNTPHNPTGTVFTAHELGELAAICVDAGLVAVSDEVYEWLTYGVVHRSIAACPGMRDRTFVVSSASKTFSVTGWRVGWVAASGALTRALRPLHQHITFCAPTPLQVAVGLTLGWALETGFFDVLRASYHAKRDALLAGLAAGGFRVVRPEGAYFVLARRPPGSEDAREFCVRMCRDVGVTPLPIGTFYADPHHGEPFVRFAFCKRDHVLAEAVRRLSTRPALAGSGTVAEDRHDRHRS
jgi:N-succinyldiaminopimelate aminotransferase